MLAPAVARGDHHGVVAVDQGALFEQDETFTVGQVANRLTRAVAGAFPAEVWVRGEIDGLRPPTANGHVYLSLCEKARGRDTATVSAVVLRQSRLRIDRLLAEHPGFRLVDGIEVRVRGRVQYGYGRVQLVVSEIDPVHTLGRLAAERDRVLGALAAEGLVGRNARLPLPLAPLRVALVTSDGSAACHDALHELEASGLGFAVAVADARVQGHGAEASILAALAHALAWRPDVVLLVRGGGARTDLATFDGDRLARGIAACPVPVLTGIGHEIDTSVADAVAHTSYKTPTACAAAVVDQVRLAAARSESAWGALTRRAVSASAGAAGELDVRAAALAHRAGTATGRAGRQVERAGRRLEPVRLGRALRREEDALRAASARVRRAALARTTASVSALDVLAARVDAADPVRILARGWSITRTADGTLVRSTTGIAPGAELHTTLADGSVHSTVHAVVPEATNDPEAVP